MAEDSYVSQATASTSHGAFLYLAANAPGASDERRTYLKFAVSGIPAGATGLTVTMNLWAESSASATFTVRQVPSTWTETGLTWNNQPALGATVTTRSGVSSGQYNSFNLGGYVTGNGTYAVAVTKSTTDELHFTSKESSANHPPQLLLSWTSTTTITTIPSTTTTTTPSTTTTTIPSTTTTTAPTVDPVLAAAGDIGCPPGAAVTATDCHQQATSDLLVGGDVTAVQTLGDNQYDSGALSDYNGSYDPSWGRVKTKTHPAPGNHEYETAGASGYFNYYGASAGDPAKGYYSYTLGAWHIVVLNSEIAHDAASTEVQWLEADLVANPATCTMAVWYEPRFSSGAGEGSNLSVTPF